MIRERRPRTSIPPVHTDTVAASRNEDRLAIDVLQYAEQTGETITLGTVERRLTEYSATSRALNPG